MNREELINKTHQDFKSGKIDFGQALEAIKITNDEFSVYNIHPEYLEKAQKTIIDELYFKS